MKIKGHPKRLCHRAGGRVHGSRGPGRDRQRHPAVGARCGRYHGIHSFHIGNVSSHPSHSPSLNRTAESLGEREVQTREAYGSESLLFQEYCAGPLFPNK